MINRPTWHYFVHGDCSRGWSKLCDPVRGERLSLEGLVPADLASSYTHLVLVEADPDYDEEMTDEDIGLTASLVFKGMGAGQVVSRTWADGRQVSIICKDSISWMTRSTPFSLENSSSDSFR